MYDRKYLIIPVSELKKIDFAKIMETSPDHLVYSSDKKKTFIKWEGDDPDFIQTLTNVQGPFTNEEMRDIISTNKWIVPKQA